MLFFEMQTFARESLIPDSSTLIVRTGVPFPRQAAIGSRSIEPSRSGKCTIRPFKHGGYDIRCKDY